MVNCSECNKEFKSNMSLSNHLRGGCRSGRSYEKKCPDCDTIIDYKSPGKLKLAIENNSKCPKCCNKCKGHSQETKDRISKKLKDLYESGELIPSMSGAHSQESRKRMAETKRGSQLSEDHKDNIRIGVNSSEKHKISTQDPIRNKKISDRMRNRIVTEETRKRMSENRADISGDKNPSKRPEVRLKLRLKLIERLGDNLKLDGKIIIPFFNRVACDYFNKIMIEKNCNIQHALNGGEFYIKELGYFVDGYDIDNNIVYEWDEKHHFKVNGDILDKDILRQDEIVSLLKCQFIRIKQSGYIS